MLLREMRIASTSGKAAAPVDPSSKTGGVGGTDPAVISFSSTIEIRALSAVTDAAPIASTWPSRVGEAGAGDGGAHLLRHSTNMIARRSNAIGTPSARNHTCGADEAPPTFRSLSLPVDVPGVFSAGDDGTGGRGAGDAGGARGLDGGSAGGGGDGGGGDDGGGDGGGDTGGSAGGRGGGSGGDGGNGGAAGGSGRAGGLGAYGGNVGLGDGGGRTGGGDGGGNAGGGSEGGEDGGSRGGETGDISKGGGHTGGGDGGGDGGDDGGADGGRGGAGGSEGGVDGGGGCEGGSLHAKSTRQLALNALGSGHAKWLPIGATGDAAAMRQSRVALSRPSSVGTLPLSRLCAK